MNDFTIVLFYKYVPIQNPEIVRDWQREICAKFNLKGRVIVATEGVNATLEGKSSDIEKYIKVLLKDPKFKETHIKKSAGTGQAFPKLSVKVRSEIVAGRLGMDDIDPNQMTGKYLSAERLHEWFEEGIEFYIVDMRNGFEQEVGHFEASLLSQFESFADLPQILPILESLKDKPIVTVCTGGVRCEKASGFLVKHGFLDVYQLYGGMHSYMEKYPNGFFKGGLYVFDGRLVVSFNIDNSQREIIGKCAKCNALSENYINCTDHFCHRHFIACLDCLAGKDSIFCPMGCRDYSLEHPELNRVRS